MNLLFRVVVGIFSAIGVVACIAFLWLSVVIVPSTREKIRTTFGEIRAYHPSSLRMLHLHGRPLDDSVTAVLTDLYRTLLDSLTTDQSFEFDRVIGNDIVLVDPTPDVGDEVLFVSGSCGCEAGGLFDALLFKTTHEPGGLGCEYLSTIQGIARSEYPFYMFRVVKGGDRYYTEATDLQTAGWSSVDAMPVANNLYSGE